MHWALFGLYMGSIWELSNNRVSSPRQFPSAPPPAPRALRGAAEAAQTPQGFCERPPPLPRRSRAIPRVSRSTPAACNSQQKFNVSQTRAAGECRARRLGKHVSNGRQPSPKSNASFCSPPVPPNINVERSAHRGLRAPTKHRCRQFRKQH